MDDLTLGNAIKPACYNTRNIAYKIYLYGSDASCVFSEDMGFTDAYTEEISSILHQIIHTAKHIIRSCGHSYRWRLYHL